MKKIALISHASVLNGAPICLAEITEGLLKEQDWHEIYFGLPVQGKILEKYDLREANPFFFARTYRGGEILVTKPQIRRRLKKIFVQKGIDLVVANTLESFRAVQAAFDLDLPCIWIIHELLTAYETRKEFAEMKAAAYLADRLIFNSQTAYRLLSLLGEGLQEKAGVIYIGINLPPEPELKKDFRAELGFRPEDIILGSIGDVCPAKGYDLLLPAFNLIFRQLPRSRLIIIGRIPPKFQKFYSRLQNLSKRLGVQDRVLFLGEQVDVSRWLNSLDLLIHPSRGESLGRVIIEALARERPVVATLSGGVEEIIKQEKNGILVSQREPEALARASLWMLAHPEEAREMGRRGRVLVREKFFLPRTLARLKQEIDSLL